MSSASSSVNSPTPREAVNRLAAIRAKVLEAQRQRTNHLGSQSQVFATSAQRQRASGPRKAPRRLHWAGEAPRRIPVDTPAKHESPTFYFRSAPTPTVETADIDLLSSSHVRRFTTEVPIRLHTVGMCDHVWRDEAGAGGGASASDDNNLLHPDNSPGTTPGQPVRLDGGGSAIGLEDDDALAAIGGGAMVREPLRRIPVSFSLRAGDVPHLRTTISVQRVASIRPVMMAAVARGWIPMPAEATPRNDRWFAIATLTSPLAFVGDLPHAPVTDGGRFHRDASLVRLNMHLPAGTYYVRRTDCFVTTAAVKLVATSGGATGGGEGGENATATVAPVKLWTSCRGLTDQLQ
mgnify:FL=1